MYHARAFIAGESLYVMGQDHDLKILRSDDRGETWTPIVNLTHDEHWHGTATNVWHKDNYVYTPDNERRRMQLHFSKNMVDWCFAGIVSIGPGEIAARHYASMIIDGDDLHILSRSGNMRAKSAHNGNIITFHTVRDFRELVY